MKVLHLEAGRHLYGGATQVLMLLRGLNAQQPDDRQLLVCARGSAVAAAAAEAGLNPLTLPMGGDLDGLLLTRLLGLIRRQRPQLVHVHSRRGADLWGGLAARLAGLPAVLSRRVDNPENRWSRHKYRYYRRVIAISAEIGRLLVEREGLAADKVRCIPSAVDSERFRPGDRRPLRAAFRLSDSDGPLLGTAAQLIERKGQHTLLQAFPAVLRQHPQARLLLFGRGPRRAALERQCQTLGLGKRVLFAGLRDDLPRLLPGLDMVVHPASMEGLGVALLEAAACGLPVVACRAGGIPEIVRDGINGRLVEPGQAAPLAAAVNELLADPERAARFGARGREIVLREFSVERMARDNHAVYRQLTGSLG